MAGFNVDFPNDFLSQLDGVFDDVAPKMIDAALPTYEETVKKSLKSSISTAPEDVKRQTGGLVSSLTISKSKKAKSGAYIGTVSFAKKDPKGSPNVVKAVGLEYGNSHQQPRPFMQTAQNGCRQDVLDKMQKIFNQEVMR